MNPENNENCPHGTSPIVCQHCDHEWVAVYAITGYDCQSLECPSCHKANWLTMHDDRDVHLVISYSQGGTWLKPSRPVPVWKLRIMLSNAQDMLAKASHLEVAVPEDFPLVVGMTVHHPKIPK